MSTRNLQVNWVALGDAVQHKRKIVLRTNPADTSGSDDAIITL